jgi:hypothetical protein
VQEAARIAAAQFDLAVSAEIEQGGIVLEWHSV